MGFFAGCVCNKTFTVSNGCPKRVTVTPPIVPANTSFADFNSVALSADGGSAALAANPPLAGAPALNRARGEYATAG
eukprot:CAMPEP_0197126936 /NCGR_PEP_ID=MMETSP1390-20130617/11261_1 /TAXON_ID=38833 /ORGANISM="Micromonas sp., Strain CCMP2099" /LENGTH=76 /DNA_ID=CAMNT_0042569191 /DNA_START=807 /DNA_END=1037 /DNA_ORIENTATION=-